jgi:hypothetical protein
VANLDDVKLAPGDNVTLSEDGMTAVANLYGYAGLIGEAPTIVSPIWMSTAHMEARRLPRATGRLPLVPTEEDLASLLDLKNTPRLN